MATEEQKNEAQAIGSELQEQKKQKNATQQLQDSLAGLDKYGGFQLLKGLLKGAENMDPRRKAVKNIFLNDFDYHDARKELINEIKQWLDILEQGSNDTNSIREDCKGKRKVVEDNVKNNLFTIHDEIKKLEITYRTLDSFFANAGQGDVECITLMNVGKKELSRYDSEDTKAIQKELWENYNQLSLTDNYSLLVIPGYLGRLDDKDTKDRLDVVQRWAQTANKNKVILITDFKDSLKYEMLKSDLNSAKLQGKDGYLANIIMTCNYLMVRKKSEMANEDDDVYIPGSGALAGLMSNTENLVISQGAAGMKFGKMNNVLGTRFNLLKDELKVLMDQGVIPMIEVDGRIMAFNNQTLYNGATLELKEYPIVRVFDWIGKVLQHFFNSQSLINWNKDVKDDLWNAVTDFLNDYQGSGKLIEQGKLLKLDQDPKTKDINVKVDIKPFFAAKNFFIELTRNKDGQVSLDVNEKS